LNSDPFTDSIPLLVGDVGGDGLDDLFVGTVLSDGTAWIWRTVSKGDINQQPSFSRLYANDQTGRSNGSWEQGVGDVNDDGRADFVLVDSSPDAASVAVLVYAGRQDNGLDYKASTYTELGKGHFKVLFANFNGAFGAETLLLYKESEPNTIYALRNFDGSTGRFNTIGMIRHENPDLLSAADWSNYVPLIEKVNDDNLDDIVWVRKGDGSVSTGLAQALQ
jgi:hypothetical protein